MYLCTHSSDPIISLLKNCMPSILELIVKPPLRPATTFPSYIFYSTLRTLFTQLVYIITRKKCIYVFPSVCLRDQAARGVPLGASVLTRVHVNESRIPSFFSGRSGIRQGRVVSSAIVGGVQVQRCSQLFKSMHDYNVTASSLREVT